MSAIDEIVTANEQYAASFAGAPPVKPRRQVTVIACMDCRLDLLGALGLQIGDAHILRNAGGIPTDDVLRSLAISQRELGTREVVVIHHTQCGMNGFDDVAFRATLAAESGQEPTWDVGGFTDLSEDVKRSVQTVRSCAWIPHRDNVRGFIFDVTAAALTEVD